MKVTIENIKLKDNTEAVLLKINRISFALTKDWHKKNPSDESNDLPYFTALKIITNINGDAKKLALLNRNSDNDILSEVSNTYLQKGEIKIEILN
jgi:hypothetical protein